MKISKELEKQILSSEGVVVRSHVVEIEEAGRPGRTHSDKAERRVQPSSAFELLCIADSLQEPIPEYHFAPPRKWRFDWAWPERKIALEIDGGVHRIKDKFARDMEKSNAAQLAGWMVLRCTPKEFENRAVMNLLARAMKRKNHKRAMP